MVSMNRLSTEKRAQIIGCLVESNSIRATVRMTGAAKNTITRLLVDLGEACAEYQDGVLVDLPCKVVEADEIWAYCYAKQKNVPEQFKGTPGYGDVWTFTAVCADTKLVPSWLVGERTMDDAEVFLTDLANRMSGRIQLAPTGTGSTKGLSGRPLPTMSIGRRSRSTTRVASWANTARRSASVRSGVSSRAILISTGSRQATLSGRT